jgi:cytochrome c
MPLARIAVFGVLLLAASGPAPAQLRGHGGPVRALAVAPDGASAVSGGFDTTAIRWSLSGDVAEQVLRLHEGAVNAVAFLADGRIATAGADARIAVWVPGRPAPDLVLTGHDGPIVALAMSPDGRMLASASWDRTVRLWPLAGGEPRVLEGHQQNVNGVAFSPDGKAVVSGGYDLTVRIWPTQGDGSPRIAPLPSPLNAVAVAPDGEIVAGGADGKVYFLAADGEPRGSIEASPAPIVALGISRNGERVAAAGIGGAVALIDRSRRELAKNLVGPGLPVWSVAFMPDGHTLLTGGSDTMVRRWNADTGEPIGTATTSTPANALAAYAGERGAEVFRACVACHTLRAEEGNRAGPTLHGLFGRRIASAPGYAYSEALKTLDIVWTPETVAKLFEVGPAAYTPGTKMPEQKIGRAEDREALVRFLERATK